VSATTMAPALNPSAPAPEAPPTDPSEPTLDGRVVVLPQHMRALARANEVRLARAQLKREIGAGRRGIVEVIRECPWEAESMSVTELLCSQRRWGRARSRKLISSLQLNESKRLGTFTQRQRELLAAALEARGAAR
jgi:hypothetical protein